VDLKIEKHLDLAAAQPAQPAQPAPLGHGSRSFHPTSSSLTVLFHQTRFTVGQTSPPPSHWMKSQYPSVAFKFLALVGSCMAQ